MAGLIVKNQKLWPDTGMLSHLDNPRIKAYPDKLDKHFTSFPEGGQMERWQSVY